MREVDLMLTRDDDVIAGVEAKASATIKSSNFAGLKTLADACKGRFASGGSLMTVPRSRRSGDKLAAVPISFLRCDVVDGAPSQAALRSAF